MSNFESVRKLPSCLVTKDLLEDIEIYLLEELPGRFPAGQVKETVYRLSIEEEIGTETLGSIKEYTPRMFSDGTRQINIYSEIKGTGFRLRTSMSFSKELGRCRLTVECDSATAREKAVGVSESILRLIKPCENHNWVFEPFSFPIVGSFCFVFSASLMPAVIEALMKGDFKKSLYGLAAASLLFWFGASGKYFRPHISFNTRRQETFSTVWKYFSLGIFGFIFFGTLLPLIRKWMFD